MDRSPLVGNLGSPATLILERPSWDAGKQTIRKAEIATVIVDALFVVVVVLMPRAKVNKGVENVKRSSVCPPDLRPRNDEEDSQCLTQTLGSRKEQMWHSSLAIKPAAARLHCHARRLGAQILQSGDPWPLCPLPMPFDFEKRAFGSSRRGVMHGGHLVH
jgi:hypothetical protein